MLYMVVATHGPETCPGANEDVRQKALGMGPRMEDVAKPTASPCKAPG